jgi:hypothetical protein
METEIGSENLSWFRAPWLFSECYMYVRINEAIFSCESDLKCYDPYDYAKRESYKTSEESILGLIKTLCPIDLNEEKNNTEMLRKKCETIIQVIIIIILFIKLTNGTFRKRFMFSETNASLAFFPSEF